MFLLKKLILGIVAFFLILWGGAGTQSQNMALQGGGFIGLIIGLVVLYIFAKMAWRAMGCLPSFLIVFGIIAFILYAIGGFNQGVGGIGQSLKGFLGQAQNQANQQSEQVGTLDLIEEGDIDPSLDENFDCAEECAEQQAPAPQKTRKQANQQKAQKTIQNMVGSITGQKPVEEEKPSFNPSDYPAIYVQAKVLNGDTLSIQGRYFRLYGIDAPESNQTCANRQGRSYNCGKQAATWLRDWINNNELECRVMQQDVKGNMVGTCSLGQYDLGAALVNAGWAVAYTKFTSIYVPYEEIAHASRNGLWQGKFYMPWDWRTLQSKKPKIKIIKPKKLKKALL